MAIVLKLSLYWSMYWLSNSLAMLFSLYHVSHFLPPSVYVCVGVTCQNRYSLDMSCPIFTHLSTPFSTPVGTRQRKPVCGTGNLYAYSTLLSTIFTLAFSLVLTQWGCTALLRAAEGGSVPLVRALLEDYISSYQSVRVCVCVQYSPQLC